MRGVKAPSSVQDFFESVIPTRNFEIDIITLEIVSGEMYPNALVLLGQRGIVLLGFCSRCLRAWSYSNRYEGKLDG